MKLKFTKIILGLALAVGLLGAPVFIVSAQVADPIKARKDNRQDVRKMMGEIKAILDAKGDVKAIAPIANRLAKAEDAHLPLYPEGSDKGETKALPTVWSDKAGFEAASRTTTDAANHLSRMAMLGDAEASAKAFGALGGTCGGCHDKFRAK